MKRTSAIVLTLAFALTGSLGCGAKSPQPDPGPKDPDPGHKTCRNPDLETCGTQPDPTSTPDASVSPAP